MPLLNPTRVIEFHDHAVVLVSERDEFLQRVEFIVFVLVAVGIRRIGIGDQYLRRLGADLQNDWLGLAPPVDVAELSTTAVTVNRRPLQV